MLPKKIAFVDLETTGGRVGFDRVIEIGVVRLEDNQITQTFKTVINPQKYLPPEITDITGITQEEVDNAPTFRRVKEEVLAILADCVFVAHNVRFDYGFLKAEFSRLGIDFSPKHFCTVKLSRNLFPQFSHHNLDALIERFNLNCPSRHRAFDDAHCLFQFYRKIQQSFSPKIVLQAIDKALKKPSIPINIPWEMIDNLPECPGVYIFYNATGTPLYIGKSINIKERVKSHFACDHSSVTEMKISQQIASIETIQTSGELSALFKESQLIKKLQPLYNRKLRRLSKMYVLKGTQTDEKYNTVRLETVEQITLEDIENVIGIFRSKKQAKQYLIEMAKQFGLCEKMLGIDSTSSSCFGYRLGRCKGACLKKESPVIYNLKYALAFSHRHFQKWPFPTPVLIEEKDPQTRKKELHLIDKWCYLGTIKSEDNKITYDYNFELDTYKIIQSFLKSPKNSHKIKPVSHPQIKAFFQL